MNIDVAIVDGPIPVPVASAFRPMDAGAVITFDGVVRALEDGRPIAALDYEVYEPMASESLRALAQQAMSAPGMLAIQVRHSRGRVPVGLPSFRLTIWSRHRAEALAAMAAFIETMKRDTPIWKKPVFAE